MTTYQSTEPRSGFPWARVAKRAALALVALVLMFVVLFAWDGWKLNAAASQLKTHAAQAQTALTEGDAAALAEEVLQVQVASDAFASHTDGPHWWIASRLPWVKSQAVPLQQAGDSVRKVADGALKPLSDLPDLDALQVPAILDGRIDPLVLEPYRATLAQAAGVLTDERAALEEVSLTGTVDQVRVPFLKLKADLDTLGETIQGAHVAAEVLPSMLGAEEPRSYIVMVQNNAEPRTTGGIAGAVLEITVDDGRITFDRYATANSMISGDEVVAKLTDDEDRIFTSRMVHYPQDVNFTPEFPRSAELMTAFWEREYGNVPDGVISVDPVALEYMLEGMADTDVNGVTITDQNLSEVMLRDSYLLYPEPDNQDTFFALASQVLFGRLVSGETSAVGGAEQAINEGRFMVWSPYSDEQDLLKTTKIAGDFIADTDALGVFLNDGSGSKIGYYIDRSTEVVDHLCADGSLRAQTVTLTLTHAYDGDVSELPWYVSGGGVYVPEGEFHANVLVYPPAGMGVTQYQKDGEAALLNPEIHHGRTVASTRVVLLPGESTTLTFDLTATQRGLSPEAFVGTPGPQPYDYIRTFDSYNGVC